MRPDEARDEMDIVLFHQLVGLLFADLRLEAVVFNDELDVLTAHFVTDVIECDIGGFHHVPSHGTGRGR